MSLINSIWSLEIFHSSNMWIYTGTVLLCILFIISFIGACILVYSGILKKIEVLTKESPYDEMTVAYKTGKGPYKGASLICNEVMEILEQNKDSKINSNTDKVKSYSPLVIGLYYDDPESVPEEELRYAVGAVLSKGKESADTRMLEAMISQGYKITVFPKTAYVVTATFPLKTRLSLYIAIFRVYPRLREYISTKGLCAYPAMEFYSQDQIQFIMPLSKQEEFFVPEFCEEQVSIATTEFSTHAPSEMNKSCFTGIDDTGSVNDSGSIHNDSHLDISSTNIRHTPDRRVKEDFGDDQISLESESEGFTTEEDEQIDRVFIKPTKPAPRRKRLSQKPETDDSRENNKDNETCEQPISESETVDSMVESDKFVQQDSNVRECSNLGAMSGSENSSMEDIAQSFVQVSKMSE